MRYAKALLLFANEGGVAKQVYQEALTLRKSFRDVPALRHAMEKPVMTRDDKQRVLEQASGGTISVQMQKFIALVLKEKGCRVVFNDSNGDILGDEYLNF